MTLRRNTRWLTLLAALIIGVLNPPVLKGFEFIVIEGTEWLWDDLLHADKYRWVAIALPVVGSILLSAAFRLTGQTRIVHQTSDVGEYGSEETKPPTLIDIGIVLLIGAGSLLFGASLGPEASLMAFAGSLGLLVAARFKLTTAGLLKAISIGALLIAFTGSIVPALFPFILLLQKAKPAIKKLPLKDPKALKGLISQNRRVIANGLIDIVLPILLASASAFFVMWLMDPSVAGYGSIPVSQPIQLIDFGLAAVAGVLALFVGTLLKKAIDYFGSLAKWMDKKWPWPVSAGAFGAGIGLLYVIGGQTVQFSGSIGSKLLVEQASTFGLFTLLGLLLVKLLVTAWSLATGYRGGLVFPTIYMGIAISFILYHLTGAVDPGVMIGAIAGVFGALTGPVVAFIFIASILPPHGSIWLVAICGIVGAWLGQRMLQRIFSRSKA